MRKKLNKVISYLIIQFNLLLLIFLVSCNENNSIDPEIDTRLHFLIHPSEYSTNHYFLDTFYFELNTFYSQGYYSQQSKNLHNFFYIKEIEVWQTQIGIYNENEIRGNLIIDLDYLTKDEKYEEILRGTSVGRPDIGRSTRIPGAFNERLYRLKENEDFLINRKTGLITILQDSEFYELRYLCVSYKIEGLTDSDEDDLVMGDLNSFENWDRNNKLPIFKLIKSREGRYDYYEYYDDIEKLNPKNIYKISDAKILLTDFTFEIYFLDDNNQALNRIDGSNLLKLFGLDNNEDGKFDAIEGINIIPETGEIMFPKLQPFGKNIPDFFKDKYEINSIYEGTKELAEVDSNINRFYFTGRYYPE